MYKKLRYAACDFMNPVSILFTYKEWFNYVRIINRMASDLLLSSSKVTVHKCVSRYLQ